MFAFGHLASSIARSDFGTLATGNAVAKHTRKVRDRGVIISRPQGASKFKRKQDQGDAPAGLFARRKRRQ
jgi:hypothetical protein